MNYLYNNKNGAIRFFSALLIITVILSLPFLTASCSNDGFFFIDIINTGDSDCILVVSGNSAVIIDAGEKDDYDTIKAQLDSRGIRKIDLMILTHYDNDHIGSASNIIYDYDVKEVIGPDYVRDSSLTDSLDRALRYKGLSLTKLPGGSEDVTMEYGKAVLSINIPQKKTYVDENDYSLIISISYEEKNFLFMGDALKDRTGEFLPYALDSYYLVKLPHHGDYFSTLGELFNNTGITFAVVTTGNIDSVESKTRLALNGSRPKGLYTFDGTVSVEFKNGKFNTYQ